MDLLADCIEAEGGPSCSRRAAGVTAGRAFDQEIDKAKGQVKKTKEVRKPKADKPKGGKAGSAVTDVFAKATEQATHHAGKK